MKVAYVDSSCLVSIALGEPLHREVMGHLSRFDQLFSSPLLEADVRAALARERKPWNVRNLLTWLTWVYPPRRRLTQELDEILEMGTLKGSDLWHLACAILVRRNTPGLFFVTLDGRQAKVARSLGFAGL